MSDPMTQPNPDPNRNNPPPPDEPHKRANPLVWILVLVALFALAWYFMSRRDTLPEPAPEPTPPIGQVEEPSETPGDQPAAATRPSPSRPAPAKPAPADRDATVRTSVEPTYPVAAARARSEGTVLIRAQVDAQGKPTDVEVARSSRSRDLDRAALSAVREWTFEPAIRDGKAVASTVQVPVEFTLSEQ